MDIMRKLEILSGAAKYDVACTSSGADRKAASGGLGSAVGCGICHTFTSDGRCVSLLKVLMTNICAFDCQYCANRRSADVPRAKFEPREIAELTMNFYRRNYIEGLFLSSAIFGTPDKTMEMLTETITLVRNEYRFNGYIHVKAIPGASYELIRAAGLVADRMSVNIELPSNESLTAFAPDKTKQSILAPMKQLKLGIEQAKNELAVYRHAPRFVPAGQSTQMIVGASNDSDKQIVSLAQGLYDKYRLKRVFYSAYIPVVTKNKMLPAAKPPLLREHRLYQADFLLRFYQFNADELFGADENLSLNMDPKCRWAVRNIDFFPVEANRADYQTLLRVPGIGDITAKRIIRARKGGRLNFDDIKKIGVVLKRAKYFLTCDGKMFQKMNLNEQTLEIALSENKVDEKFEQLSILDEQGMLLPATPLLTAAPAGDAKIAV